MRLQPALMKQLRMCPDVLGLSLLEIRAAFEEGTRLRLFTRVLEWDVAELRASLAGLGLRTTFEPTTEAG
jgi:hypothetical protein